MSADTDKTGPIPDMRTVPWAEQSDQNLLCRNGEPMHYVIVDYGIGGEAKAYAELMEINKRLPTVTAELVQARDFTHAYKAQLYASERNWILVHICNTLAWRGHGMWITRHTGDIVAYHGGSGDKGWCAPMDPGMVYSNDYANPQLSKHSFIKGLEETLEHGSPLDYPKQIFVAENTTDDKDFRKFVDRIKTLVKQYDIKVILKPYEQLIMQAPDTWSNVFLGLEKDRAQHESILQIMSLKVRKEIKNGPKKPLEGLKGDTGYHGRSRR